MSKRLCSPDCECDERLARFQAVLSDESMRFTAEEIQGLEAVIYVILCTIEHHCADPVFRMWAKAQLTDRHWDEQKAMEVSG